ncbi:MAG: ABC transporter substrate-binding protein [Gammaproteobacteria bacterium]|nr:ABC transporter substrate-binding protein [Gammaproteobacteria bacterium]
MKVVSLIRSVCAIVVVLVSAASFAQTKLEVDIVYLGRQMKPLKPLSLLDDTAVENDGVPGSMLGLNDTQTTGSFMNHLYRMEQVMVEPTADLVGVYRNLVGDGKKLFIADLNAQDIESIAVLEKNVLIFNIRARDDILRNEKCHPDVLHIPPSRSMLADALAQYLVWKRWNKVVLVTGRHPEDRAYAIALKRAASRYGLKIVQEKNWTAVPGARRTDSGHHSLQQEIPVFTQFKDHDVLLVADEQDEFGEYLSYRTTRARPVGGTQGLQPTSWHRTQEQWGATQIQRRFAKLANRWMTELDYAAWAAVRSVGEAVTNTGSNEPEVLKKYLLSKRFKLAGFKGVALTFRDWNGQLRQPILVVGPRMLVTVSPQAGFLHQYSELDTLGFDQPESSCKGF